jgi:hypothetical protein
VASHPPSNGWLAPSLPFSAAPGRSLTAPGQRAGRRPWLQAPAPLCGFGDANPPRRLTSGTWGCVALPRMARCQSHWPSVVINQFRAGGEGEKKTQAPSGPGAVSASVNSASNGCDSGGDAVATGD